MTGQIHYTDLASIDFKFREFHAANPQVFLALERLAARWFARGKRKCGVGALWEVMRWEMALSTEGDDFKLNNNYRSRYVRLLIKHHPDWEDRFEIRQLRSW